MQKSPVAGPAKGDDDEFLKDLRSKLGWMKTHEVKAALHLFQVR